MVAREGLIDTDLHTHTHTHTHSHTVTPPLDKNPCTCTLLTATRGPCSGPCLCLPLWDGEPCAMHLAGGHTWPWRLCRGSYVAACRAVGAGQDSAWLCGRLCQSSCVWHSSHAVYLCCGCWAWGTHDVTGHTATAWLWHFGA